MARKEKLIEIKEGQDKGRLILIKELSAFKCERWAEEVLSRVAKAAAQYDSRMDTIIHGAILDNYFRPSSQPDDVVRFTDENGESHAAIFKGQTETEEELAQKRNEDALRLLAIIGVRCFTFLSMEDRDFIFSELLAECFIKEDDELLPIYREGELTQFAKEFIEDPKTVLKIKQEAFNLHLGFFEGVGNLILKTYRMAQALSQANAMDQSD